MYDQDLLEGQIITHWQSKYCEDLNPKFNDNIARLIDHLAESSEEESEDESDWKFDLGVMLGWIYNKYYTVHDKGVLFLHIWK